MTKSHNPNEPWPAGNAPASYLEMELRKSITNCWNIQFDLSDIFEQSFPKIH